MASKTIEDSRAGFDQPNDAQEKARQESRTEFDKINEKLEFIINELKGMVVKTDFEDFKDDVRLALKKERDERDRMIRIMEDKFQSYDIMTSRTRNRYIRLQRHRSMGNSVSDSDFRPDPIY
jgi:hypothetical protein